jgi:phosphate transport system protein
METHRQQLIDHLKSELLKMGAAVEESIAEAMRALVDRDAALAQKVIAGNRRIDGWEVAIEEEAIGLMATQQPVASDLRLLAILLKMNYDLERINDQAVNIAERAQALLALPMLKPLIDLPRMAQIAQTMVKDALDAFVQRDEDLARDVCRRDEQVDLLRDQVFRELLTYMHGGEPDTIDRAIQLILISRHLERIGDHASNIAENVAFLVEGRIVRHQKQGWWDGGGAQATTETKP